MLHGPSRTAGCKAWVRLAVGVDRLQRMKKAFVSLVFNAAKFMPDLRPLARAGNGLLHQGGEKQTAQTKKGACPKACPFFVWVRG
jgi:hypothetical protein